MLVLTMALAATAAAPVAAQLLAGMPAWNSPKGGTGLTLSADYGLPNSDAGGGDAYGIRGSFGFSKFTIAAGYSGYQADGVADRLSSYGAGAAFQLLGGALNPVNVNIVGGSATTGNVPVPLGRGSTTMPTPARASASTCPFPASASSRTSGDQPLELRQRCRHPVGHRLDPRPTSVWACSVCTWSRSQEYGGTTAARGVRRAHGSGVPDAERFHKLRLSR
jgi:hypothetical protein